MKTYEEMAQNALNRISNYETEQRKRRKTVAKIATPAVSFCLAAVLSIGAWQSGLFKPETPPVNAGNTDLDDSYYSSDKTAPNNSDEVSEQDKVGLNTTDNNNAAAANQNIGAEEKPDAQIASGDNNGQKGVDTNSANGFCEFWWNKLIVSGPLYNAIENNPDSVFAILATYRPTTANVTSFTYEGKTLAEWAAEAFEENASQDAKKGYELAYNAYLETVLPSAVSRLSENNIKCGRASYVNNGLILLVTAEELKSLPLEDLGNWHFNLDSGNLKGTSNIETDATGLQVVN